MNHELGARRWKASHAILAGCAALTACQGSAPTGQVVAKVNGEEITRRDVDADIAAANLPANADIPKIQPLVVDRIVDRKLLVDEAKKQGLDKRPDFLAAEQRMQDILLISELEKKAEASVKIPSPEDVSSFVAKNPQMFGGRRLLKIDQLVVPAAGIDQNDLRPLNSNDEIITWLNGRGIKFARQSATLDTASLPKEAVQKIDALAPNMPFVVGQGSNLLINQVVGQQPAPVPEADVKTLATRALVKQATQQQLKGLLAGLRASAKLEYQRGFAPPAKAATTDQSAGK